MHKTDVFDHCATCLCLFYIFCIYHVLWPVVFYCIVLCCVSHCVARSHLPYVLWILRSEKVRIARCKHSILKSLLLDLFLFFHHVIQTHNSDFYSVLFWLHLTLWVNMSQNCLLCVCARVKKKSELWNKMLQLHITFFFFFFMAETVPYVWIGISVKNFTWE